MLELFLAMHSSLSRDAGSIMDMKRLIKEERVRLGSAKNAEKLTT